MTDRFDEMARAAIARVVMGLTGNERDIPPQLMCDAMANLARAAVTAETERCAAIADAHVDTWHGSEDANDAAVSIAVAIRARPILWTQSADSTREDQVWTASANDVDLRVVYEYNDYERGGSVDCVIAWTAVTSSNVYGPFAAQTLPNAKSDAEEFARKMAR